MPFDPQQLDPAFHDFWREPRFATLTTPYPDGSPHVVLVGATYDPEAALARVITLRTSVKVRNIRAAGPAGAAVALCLADGPRWLTLGGTARVTEDPAAVAEAVARYAERYGRAPVPNPDRVAVEITPTRVLGNYARPMGG